jgi:hypothetical protein
MHHLRKYILIIVKFSEKGFIALFRIKSHEDEEEVKKKTKKTKKTKKKPYNRTKNANFKSR